MKKYKTAYDNFSIPHWMKPGVRVYDTLFDLGGRISEVHRSGKTPGVRVNYDSGGRNVWAEVAHLRRSIAAGHIGRRR